MLATADTRWLEDRLERLRAQKPRLHGLAAEQDTLMPGSVAPAASHWRLAVANRVNEACQRLELDLAGTADAAPMLGELRSLRALAERVLRENPVLQARGSLAVIRAADMPDRFVLNLARRREVRRGFGLHRGVRNDEGPSVVVAFTPPRYAQLWHAHTVDEYTLALDTDFDARYADRTVRRITALDGDLLHFFPHTYHTLVNRGRAQGRTFTLKYPLGISVWVPALHLTGTERGRAELRRVPWARAGRGVWVRALPVRDAYHRYTLHLAVLGAGARFAVPCPQDRYLYVLGGCVEARRQTQTVTATADDLIVSEPTPALRLSAICPASLYWAADLEPVPPPLPPAADAGTAERRVRGGRLAQSPVGSARTGGDR